MCSAHFFKFVPSRIPFLHQVRPFQSHCSQNDPPQTYSEAHLLHDSRSCQLTTLLTVLSKKKKVRFFRTFPSVSVFIPTPTPRKISSFSILVSRYSLVQICELLLMSSILGSSRDSTRYSGSGPVTFHLQSWEFSQPCGISDPGGPFYPLGNLDFCFVLFFMLAAVLLRKGL